MAARSVLHTVVRGSQASLEGHQQPPDSDLLILRCLKNPNAPPSLQPPKNLGQNHRLEAQTFRVTPTGVPAGRLPAAQAGEEGRRGGALGLAGLVPGFLSAFPEQHRPGDGTLRKPSRERSQQVASAGRLPAAQAGEEGRRGGALGLAGLVPGFLSAFPEQHRPGDGTLRKPSRERSQQVASRPGQVPLRPGEPPRLPAWRSYRLSSWEKTCEEEGASLCSPAQGLGGCISGMESLLRSLAAKYGGLGKAGRCTSLDPEEEGCFNCSLPVAV
ncbi:hypothetical protein TREES_T100008800 [Tupaia chinensis]|uniref:Uncharacterized protein n=1 Tax=Tupaia chinensis TaxID=246437 RepID=L9L0G0_TUPCH|nr:hypothetical protein TREES_T100008800 [Tupaia chinensis]